MKSRTLRLWIALLLLTLFSQTLQAAVRSVHCAWGNVPQQNVQQQTISAQLKQHCHGNRSDTESFNSSQSPASHTHSHLHVIAQQVHDAGGSHQDATTSHCQPGCSCCWNACSASLSNDTRAMLSLHPNSEIYRKLPTLLPASPVEQALRPPCKA